MERRCLQRWATRLNSRPNSLQNNLPRNRAHNRRQAKRVSFSQCDSRAASAVTEVHPLRTIKRRLNAEANASRRKPNSPNCSEYRGRDDSCLLMKTVFALLVLFVALSACTAQTSLVSDWSATSNHVRLRVVCPDNLMAGGKDRIFWVKCELKSEGNQERWLSNRARLFLTDDQGKTQRCLRRNLDSTTPGEPGFDYSRLLKAHETNSWWENGVLEKPGRYRLYAVLDNFDIQSQPLPVNITISPGGDEETVRAIALQRHFDGFPLVTPNAAESEGTYHWIAFTNDPVVVDGELHYAFRFKAPDEPRNLVWSCFYDKISGQTWYIVPRTNRMEGFTEFRWIAGSVGVPGLGRADDYVFFQDLPARCLEPGAEYCLWFRPAHGLLKGVMASINLSKDYSVDFRATPEAIKERNLHDPPRPAPDL